MTKVSPIPRPEWHSPEYRYRNDGRFHGLVDMLEGFLHGGQYDTAEIREAAVLAANHYHMRKAPEPMVVIGGAMVRADEEQRGPAPVVFVDGIEYRRADGGVLNNPAAAERAFGSTHGRYVYEALRRMAQDPLLETIPLDMHLDAMADRLGLKYAHRDNSPNPSDPKASDEILKPR